MIRFASLIAAVTFALPALAQTSSLPAVAGEARGGGSCSGQRWCVDFTIPASDLFPQGSLKSDALNARASLVDAGPALKPRVTVAGEIVRIGDLVDNAGAVA